MHSALGKERNEDEKKRREKNEGRLQETKERETSEEEVEIGRRTLNVSMMLVLLGFGMNTLLRICGSAPFLGMVSSCKNLSTSNTHSLPLSNSLKHAIFASTRSEQLLLRWS